MMAGANAVLSEAGCALVGGHTSEGAELALGFAVNGLVDRAAVLRKGGLEPGDALILTKPDRHGHPACGRHAREGQGALGRGGARAYDRLEPRGCSRSCGGTAFMRQPT